ncbi:MAG: ABC transporter substrate-binding protein [Acutalibacteraceae bacterium]
MKKFVCITLALVLMLGLFAACNKTDDDTTATTKGTADTTPIKIGILGCHTGEYAVYGLAVKNGATLYIDKINAAGGINGKQVKIVVYDNKADNAEAVNAFNRMVEEGITALIGDVLTGNTLAVVAEANPINMPMITASATADSVTFDADSNKVYKNVFRTCFIDPFQGQKMAGYAKEILSAKTAAIIFETGNDYAIGLKEAFKTKAAQVGITIVQEEGYAKGDKDFKSQMTNINAKNPDVVFCPNYYEDVGMIVTQAREAGIKGTFLGGDGWAGVKKFASADDLEGCVFTSGYASGSTKEVKDFETEYTAKYGKDTLNMFAATSYDAAMVLCNALKVVEDKGGMTAGSDEYKQAVINAIRDNSDGVKGITSPEGYTFDAKNNPVKPVVVIKLAGGEETFDRIY